jgi:hypothetical protein
MVINHGGRPQGINLILFKADFILFYLINELLLLGPYVSVKSVQYTFD